MTWDGDLNGSANPFSCIKPSIEGDGALCPFIDLFNHRPNTDVLTGYNARRGTFEVIVNSAVKKGEQVFIEYGFEKETGSNIY